MKSVSLSTKNEVLGRLRIAGFNMKEFAAAEGYEADTVRKVVNRYVGSGKTPRGPVSRQILQKLGEKIQI